MSDLSPATQAIIDASNCAGSRCVQLHIADAFRAARRPKPPSLKEQALEVLNITQKGYGLAQVDLDTIRQALEALPDD